MEILNLFKNKISDLYKDKDRVLRDSGTTVVLVCIFFVLSNVLFLLRNGFLTNEFLENYHYVLIANMFVLFASALITPNKKIKVVYIVILIGVFIFLMVYSVFVIWLTGLAKAFSHG